MAMDVIDSTCLLYTSLLSINSMPKWFGSDRMESVLGRNWSQRIPW